MGLLFNFFLAEHNHSIIRDGRTQLYLPHHRLAAWKCKITKSPAFETKHYGHPALLLYKNIDKILPNKLHEPMYYKIGVTCVYNGHVFYTLLLQYNNFIHLFQNLTVSGECLYTILHMVYIYIYIGSYMHFHLI